MHRVIAAIFTLLLGSFALLFGAITISAFAAALAHDSADFESVGALILYLLAPALSGMSAYSIWQHRSIARWFLLALSLLCIVRLPLIAPEAIALYKHYVSPPIGAYVTLTKEKFLSALTQLLFAPVLCIAFTTAATAWAFTYFKRPKEGQG